MRASRMLLEMRRVRAQVRRMNELDRVVRHANEHSGTLVTDNSSGYDNRALGWYDHDPARPTIGFRAN